MLQEKIVQNQQRQSATRCLLEDSPIQIQSQMAEDMATVACAGGWQDNCCRRRRQQFVHLSSYMDINAYPCLVLIDDESDSMESSLNISNSDSLNILHNVYMPVVNNFEQKTIFYGFIFFF